MKHQRQGVSGFSLLELLIVMAIIATLVVVSFVIFRLVHQRVSTEKAQSDVGRLIAAAHVWRADKTHYTGISLASLCQEKLLQHDYCVGKVMNPWGGTYTIKGAKTNGQVLSITITTVKGAHGFARVLMPLSLEQKNVTVAGTTVTILVA